MYNPCDLGDRQAMDSNLLASGLRKSQSNMGNSTVRCSAPKHSRNNTLARQLGRDQCPSTKKDHKHFSGIQDNPCSLDLGQKTGQVDLERLT